MTSRVPLRRLRRRTLHVGKASYDSDVVTNPVLTIAVPTFERDKSLRKCLGLLLPLLIEHGEKLELLILDNASTDETASVVETFLTALPPGIKVKSFHHEHNIGMSENILACVERSAGTYFMFIGDDDMLYPEGLRSVLSLLERDDAGSSILQGHWPNYGVSREQTDSIEPLESLDYFFFAGNASAAISRTSFMKEALKSFRKYKSLKGNIWPQTFLIFHSVFAHPESPPLISSFPHGAMINENWIVRPDKKYTLRIIEDMLDVAVALRPSVGTAPPPREFFTGHTGQFFEAQIRLVINRSLRDLDGTSTSRLFWKLAVHRIPVPLILRVRMLLTRVPRAFLALTILDLLAKGGPHAARRFLVNLRAQRSDYRAEVRSAPITGLRVQDFC